jgi:hypothetical protein
MTERASVISAAGERWEHRSSGRVVVIEGVYQYGYVDVYAPTTGVRSHIRYQQFLRRYKFVAGPEEEAVP